jgi:chromosome segregation ATPase
MQAFEGDNTVRDRLGNIDQIRELLFGHIIADYEQRWEKSSQQIDALETELSSFQTETRDRLNALQESLTTEFRSRMDAFEKQVQYLGFTLHEQTTNMQYRVREVEKSSGEGIESLQTAVVTSTNAMRSELTQTREQLEGAVRSLEKHLFDEIDKELAAMREGKVSRVDFADALFDLCLKVKGADFVPKLGEAPGSAMGAEYLLPEQTKIETSY